MDIRNIFSIFKRWLWLLILGALVAGAAGYYISSRQTPLYQASTRFVILRAASTSYDYYAYLDYQQLVSTYTQLLSTDALLEQVSQEVGFPVYGGADAEQIGDTQFVNLTVTHQDPQKAATIANALVQVLIEQNEQLQSVRYETTRQNMQQRAEQAFEQMETLQTQINEISDENVQEQIAQVEIQIEDLQGQVTDLEIKIANINASLSPEEQSSQRIAYQAELDQIQPILELYQELYTQLTVMGEPIQNENMTSTRIEQLQRTYNLYEQIYFNSIASIESLDLTKVQSTPNVVQVELATPPQSPFSPRPVQTAALSAAVGLFLVGGLAFLVEYLDDTLKTPDDVKDILGLPVIGFVANMNGKGNKNNAVGTYVADHPRSPITEAFRSLRTSLEFYSVDEPLRMLLVTSAGPEEGKTTVATNLAIILARSNKKVLLLDADMRKPSVHLQLDLPNRIGLSDLIRGRVSVSDAIQHTKDILNLSVITSGSLPPNPAELIASQKMTHLIEEFKSQFEMVIIDTPPAIVTDAQILSNKIDGVLYVVKPGKTRAVNALTPLEEFNRVGAKLIGVVMNRIPRSREYYYGGYGYYSLDTSKEQKYYRSEESVDLTDLQPEKSDDPIKS